MGGGNGGNKKGGEGSWEKRNPAGLVGRRANLSNGKAFTITGGEGGKETQEKKCLETLHLDRFSTLNKEMGEMGQL